MLPVPFAFLCHCYPGGLHCHHPPGQRFLSPLCPTMPFVCVALHKFSKCVFTCHTWPLLSPFLLKHQPTPGRILPSLFSLKGTDQDYQWPVLLNPNNIFHFCFLQLLQAPLVGHPPLLTIFSLKLLRLLGPNSTVTLKK